MEELERGDVYVALDGEQIVGVVRTDPQEKSLYIQQIAVDPSRQGRSVGSWILVRIEEVARSRALGGLALETAELAVANIRLYRRHGSRSSAAAHPTMASILTRGSAW